MATKHYHLILSFSTKQDMENWLARQKIKQLVDTTLVLRQLCLDTDSVLYGSRYVLDIPKDTPGFYV